jgi:hypothetical protein
MRNYRLIFGSMSLALTAFFVLALTCSTSTTRNQILLAQKVASIDPTRDPNEKSGGRNDSSRDKDKDRKDAGKSGGDSDKDKGKGGTGSADGGGKTGGSKTGKA